MKKHATFLFFGMIFYSLAAFSQSEINKFDEQGQRHGSWKKFYPGTDQLRYEGTFDHGKEVGEFKFYCESCKDIPMVSKTFNRKDNIADVKYYTVKGKLVSEGKMDGKKRIGEWVFYHEKSKQLMSRENYIAGKLDGKKITYYPNGNITEEVTYKNGIKEGPETHYSPEGVLLKKLQYTNDKLQGEALHYDAFGNLVIEGYYKNGKKHGLWKYYKDGKLVLEESYPKPKPEQN